MAARASTKGSKKSSATAGSPGPAKGGQGLARSSRTGTKRASLAMASRPASEAGPRRSAHEVRETFLAFFESKGHRRFRSMPLVPAGDATLLFTNAGMVQFKDVFTGRQPRPVPTACSSQKCLRVSGKHNDLEEVGRTPRHHTLFEMLGNFSFGDYFKRDAIRWAWELLTEVYRLDGERLVATVFSGEGLDASAGALGRDEEAASLWREQAKLPPARILYLGAKDNFWAMGDTGPCGPCSELLYDQGPGVVPCADPAHCGPTCACGRWLEIWNLVFMQYERGPDGAMRPLPSPSIDTGAGLERLCAVLQGQSSNYHTDLFLPLLAALEGLAGVRYARSASDDDVSLRVIADHARAAAFLIADGVLPSNEGRGYVLRRVLRRAIRHGHRLRIKDVFMPRVTAAVVELMGAAYPELRDNAAFIEQVVTGEEQGFRRTLDTGMRLLGDEVGALRARQAATIPGAVVFKLYDTYGFPKDLTAVIAAEQGLAIDEAGFEAAMDEQRRRGGAFAGADGGADQASAQAHAEILARLTSAGGLPLFVGYDHEQLDPAARPGRWQRLRRDGQDLLAVAATVRALAVRGRAVDRASPGDEVELVVDPNPYYGEGGGQAGDRGLIWWEAPDGTALGALRVATCVKVGEQLTLARGSIVADASGPLRVGDAVWAGYRADERQATRAHHSGTHLLHAALRAVLGDHVRQSGSFVAPDRLRFDYAHFAQPEARALRHIEDHVQGRVRPGQPVTTEVLAYEQAQRRGAMMLFGEKYGDVVRVVSMAGSVEFCGGTHAASTAEIEPLIVVREEALAAGVRRIEALAGPAARGRIAAQQAWTARVLWPLLAGEPPAAARPDEPQAEEDGALQAARTTWEKILRSLAAPATTGLSALPALPAVPAAGPELLDRWRLLRHLLAAALQLPQARPAELPGRVAELASGQGPLVQAAVERMASLLHAQAERQRAEAAARQASAGGLAGRLVAAATRHGEVHVIGGLVDEVPAQGLRDLADEVRRRVNPCVLCLVHVSDKVSLVVAATAELEGRLHAGELARELAALVGGRGGGKPGLAQAGGPDVAAADTVVARFLELVAARLAA